MTVTGLTLTALLGWALGLRALTRLGSPRGYTMKVNTALGLLGLVVALHQYAQGRTGPRRAVAALVLTLALATLAQWGLGIDLGIDQLLVSDPVQDVGAPGRPSAGTAIGLAGLSLALLLGRPPAQAPNLAHVFALSTLALAAFALIAYAFVPGSLGTFAPFVSLSLPTAASLALLTVGWLRLTKDTVLWRTAAGPGDVVPLVRRVLLAGTLVPLVLGGLAQKGLQHQLYDASMAVALQASLTIFVLLGLTIALGRALQQAADGREAARKALQASEQTFRQLFDESPQMLFSVDARTGHVVTANRAFQQRLLGTTRSSLSVPVDSFLTGASQSTWEAAMDRARGQAVHGVELDVVTPQGSERRVELSAQPALEGGALLRCAWVDRTQEHRRARHRSFLLGLPAVAGGPEDQLVELLTTTAAHLGATACMLWHREASQGRLRSGTSLVDITEDATVPWASLLPSGDHGPALRHRVDLLGPSGAPVLSAEQALVAPIALDPQTHYVLVLTAGAAPPWDAEDLDLAQRVAVRAATHAQTADQLQALSEINLRLKRSLDERDVLLQEIHHRVKNNLNVISGLIRLQMRRVEHADAREALSTCSERVLAIAAIHEQLYLSDDYAAVPFVRYVEEQVRHLGQLHDVQARGLTLELVATTEAPLSIDQAIPTSLILQELVTNALKHAFPEARRGAIQIRLQATEATYRLQVCDDGIGMASSSGRPTSLGWTLVQSLTRQLRGSLEVEGPPGTSVVLTFPREPDP